MLKPKYYWVLWITFFIDNHNLMKGNAHHTVFSQALNTECIEDLAEMTKVELLIIDGTTEIRNFKATLAGNEHHFDTN